MSGCDRHLCRYQRRSVLILILILIDPPWMVLFFHTKKLCYARLCHTTATRVRPIIHMLQGIATRPSRCEEHPTPRLYHNSP
jgi:hypothetical protein